MSQVLIPPTVGRVVWFYPAANAAEGGFHRHANGGGPYAAVIAHVWSDHLVNLAVFDANGVAHGRTSVALLHSDETATDSAFCMWMPFQKGQAKAQAVAKSTEVPVPDASLTPRERADALARMQQDVTVEQRLQAKGKTAPRVTPDDLATNIVDTEIVKHVAPSGQILRWAVLTTRSGFAVTGRPSAAVSAENDDPEIGVATAIDNARNELWQLMGYALKDRLAAP